MIFDFISLLIAFLPADSLRRFIAAFLALMLPCYFLLFFRHAVLLALALLLLVYVASCHALSH